MGHRIIFQNDPQRNMKRKFHDFLTLLTSTEKKLLTVVGFELAPSGTPVRRSTCLAIESLGIPLQFNPSDSIAQLVERRTGVPEGASSNPARVNSFCVVLCCVELCCVVLCCVVLCRVVLCRVVSCRVVSCRVETLFKDDLHETWLAKGNLTQGPQKIH